MPSPRLSRIAGVAAIASATAVAGCGSGDGAAGAVKAKVQQFASAAKAHDYTTICGQVLAPELLGDLRLSGLSCEQALHLGLDEVRNASIVVGQITVTGRRATALTVTQASGQEASVATIVLIDTASGWRISSLGKVG